MSDHLPATPKPGSLVARALGLIRQPAAIDARTALSTAPRFIDFDHWIDAHEDLSYHLVHIAVKGAGQPGNDHAANTAVGDALTQLMDHARLITNRPRPLLLAKDGVHMIPYERLAESRAKVQVLTAENAELRALLAAGAQEHGS